MTASVGCGVGGVQSRGGSVDYVAYHGDVVEAQYKQRSERLAPGEAVFNSGLADLCVKSHGKLSEVYEVKTSLGRQALYAAIGQEARGVKTPAGSASGRLFRSPRLLAT